MVNTGEPQLCPLTPKPINGLGGPFQRLALAPALVISTYGLWTLLKVGKVPGGTTWDSPACLPNGSESSDPDHPTVLLDLDLSNSQMSH